MRKKHTKLSESYRKNLKELMTLKSKKKISKEQQKRIIKEIINEATISISPRPDTIHIIHKYAEDVINDTIIIVAENELHNNLHNNLHLDYCEENIDYLIVSKLVANSLQTLNYIEDINEFPSIRINDYILRIVVPVEYTDNLVDFIENSIIETIDTIIDDLIKHI